MLLQTKEIQIPEEDPFRFDVLHREECAEALTEFVCSAKDSMVICVDAQWGQGKTTFFQMWRRHLLNHEIPTIYFNAWKNNFSDDAIVCLIGEMRASLPALIEELVQREEALIQDAFDRVMDTGSVLIPRSFDAAAQLSRQKSDDENVRGASEKIARQEILQYEHSRRQLLAFREALRQFVVTLSDTEKPTPLIFIIDELERCRPDFSIAVLEKLKHVFNAENIVFVLGMDKEQFGSSMKTVYGEGLNVQGCFQRFVDFDYILPTSHKGEFVKVLFTEYGFSEYFASGSVYFQKLGVIALNIFASLFAVYKLTLREQKNACRTLSLVIRTTKTKTELHPIFLCFLIVLKTKVPPDYHDFVNGKTSAIEMLLRFRKDVHGEQIRAGFCIALEAYIFSARAASYAEVLEESRKFFSETNLERMFLEFQRLQRENGIGSLAELATKLEVISRFRG